MNSKTPDAFEHLHAAHKAAQLLHAELLGVLMTVQAPHDGWLDIVAEAEVIERQLSGALNFVESVFREDPAEFHRVVPPTRFNPALSEA